MEYGVDFTIFITYLGFMLPNNCYTINCLFFIIGNEIDIIMEGNSLEYMTKKL